jgi:hypothetical protein
MPWFWTDDLAELLNERADIGPETLSEWTRRPVAYAVPEGTDPHEAAQALLGVDREAVPDGERS